MKKRPLDTRLIQLAEAVRQGPAAFDGDLAAFRAACREVLTLAIEAGRKKQDDRRLGQGSMFDEG